MEKTYLQTAINDNEVRTIKVEDDRTGMSEETLKRAFLDNLFYLQGVDRSQASPYDYYLALAYTIRDRLLHRWLTTQQTYIKKDVRTVCYLSAEFLVGPHLANNLINLGIYEQVQKAVSESGLKLEETV